uniref:Uncharacterized protein n=1 Tax=Arundo donax TaxID=35708 RepID=A0A0A9CKI8_ARUDO
MPPCIQMIFFSISAAKGSQLNNLFIRCQVQIPSLSPIRSIHSIRKPNKALISAAS